MEFGARPLFSNATFVIGDRERVALVGKNGAGKSTLLKILAGLQKPTAGTVSISRDTTVGYLPQVMKLSDSQTVMQETEKAFAGVEQLRRHIEQLNSELASRTDYESEEYMALVERYTRENERFQITGGGNYHAAIERTLTGLGFVRSDFDRPTSEFSGGWRMRIELAKILLQSPDLLLLDEPTNHLDIESIQWFENFLAGASCSVLLVSHDRAFLNNVTNRTMEISVGKITDYRVGYDEYVKLRAERREQQLRAYENQQKEIADIKSFVERFRYKPTKANQVQSRLKQLEKIVPVEVDEVDNASLHLKFPRLPADMRGRFEKLRRAQYLFGRVVLNTPRRKSGFRRQKRRRQVNARKVHYGRDTFRRETQGRTQRRNRILRPKPGTTARRQHNRVRHNRPRGPRRGTP